MGKIFITGSSDGVGSLAAQALARRGHTVYLHARSARRAADARAACPGAAEEVLVADLSSADETRRLAARLGELGPWDAVVHNAGVVHGPVVVGVDGGRPTTMSAAFAVNTLAPYLLTCLVRPPARRYVFVSSDMHFSGSGGGGDLDGLAGCGYSDSKLHNVMLANWFARRFRDLGSGSGLGGSGSGGGDVDVGAVPCCNSLTPGWVATKLGGAGAPGDMGAAVDTYVLLAQGTGAAEGQTGKYWASSRQRRPKAEACDEARQDRLVESLAEISGVRPP